MEAKKLLKGGTTSFVAYLLNRPKDQLKFGSSGSSKGDQRGVSLPSERKLVLVIETIPGAEPFSKKSYRMTPAKLKELR